VKIHHVLVKKKRCQTVDDDGWWKKHCAEVDDYNLTNSHRLYQTNKLYTLIIKQSRTLIVHSLYTTLGDVKTVLLLSTASSQTAEELKNITTSTITTANKMFKFLREISLWTSNSRGIFKNRRYSKFIFKAAHKCLKKYLFSREVNKTIS